MKRCQECENAIFDEIWGEYKCRARKIVVYDDNQLDCTNFKKGTPATSKKEATDD